MIDCALRRRTAPFVMQLHGRCITDRVAVGPGAGQTLFTLQTVPARLQGLEGSTSGAATSGGFSLHAGIGIQPGRRAKLERLRRYVSRPPVATDRSSCGDELGAAPEAGTRDRDQGL